MPTLSVTNFNIVVRRPFVLGLKTSLTLGIVFCPRRIYHALWTRILSFQGEVLFVRSSYASLPDIVLFEEF